jgi:polyisoprenoid-binding protein YceI
MIKVVLKTLAVSMLILALVAKSHTILAQGNFSLKSFTGSVQGTSNVRDWKSTINDIRCKASFQSTGNKLESIKNVEIKILVESIKGTEGESMDRKTYESFKSDKYPFIIYTFERASVRIDGKNNVTIEPVGDLTMAGTTLQIPFSAKGKVLPNGDLQLFVSKNLDLGDFKIEPPTALLGTVRVSEDIILNFELLLTQSKK